jgi:hypothetical protein
VGALPARPVPVVEPLTLAPGIVRYRTFDLTFTRPGSDAPASRRSDGSPTPDVAITALSEDR